MNIVINKTKQVNVRMLMLGLHHSDRPFKFKTYFLGSKDF
jgi:hypothetical protein